MFSAHLHVVAGAALLAMAGSAFANDTHAAFVDVAGSAAKDGFSELTSGRINTATLVSGLAPNVEAGAADNDAILKRLSGTFYPASFGLYSFSTDSTFSFTVADAVDGLGKVTLQSFVSVDTSQGVEGLLHSGYLPTLSYNGGTQKLVAAYTLTSVSGGVGMDGSPLEASPSNPNYGYFSWDLSGVSGSVDSFTINFGLDVHSSALAFQVDQSLAAPVPEPESYALMLAGLGAVALLARRRKTIER